MKLICVVLMSIVLSACGSSSDSPTDGGDINEPDNSNPIPDPGEDTGNNPTPDEGTVNTNPDGSTGTAVFGFGPIQAREANQPADIDDWYNLFWFDPSPPHQESTIAEWQNAAASATTEAEQLIPILVSHLSEVYSSVEAGILVSDDPVVQALAVSAHAQIERNIDSTCVVIENGIITLWACAGSLQTIYEVPGGGKLLVSYIFINNNDIQTNTMILGNSDTSDAEKGYGVNWRIQTQLDPQLVNNTISTSIANPTLPARFADNIGTLSGIDVVRDRETDAFNAAAFMMRTLRTGQ